MHQTIFSLSVPFLTSFSRTHRFYILILERASISASYIDLDASHALSALS